MRRLYILPLLVCLFPLSSYAQYTKLQGWCEDGNVSVVIPGTQGSGTQKFQRSFPSCTVTVTDTGAGTNSTIYGDSIGTAKANPFTASSSGQWFFYGVPGNHYSIQFSGGSVSVPFTIGDWIAPSSANIINVLTYGAKADGGITDNLTAFNAAVTIACASGGAKSIYIPGATNWYGISNTWIINACNGITIYGDGFKSMVVTTTANHAMKITASDEFTLHSFGVGSTAVAASIDGVQLGVAGATHVYDGHIEDFYCFRGFQNSCINIVNRAQSLSMNNLHIDGNQTVPFSGLSVTAPNYCIITNDTAGNSNAVTITGSTLAGCQTYGVQTGSNVEGWTFLGGTFQGNGSTNNGCNMYFNGSHHMLILNVYMESVGTASCNAKINNSQNVHFFGGPNANNPAGAGSFVITGSVQTTIEDLWTDSISIDSASTHTHIRDVTYSCFGGTISDSGAYTEINGLYNCASATNQVGGRRLISSVNYATNGSFENWTSTSALLQWATTGTGTVTLSRAGTGESDTTSYTGQYSAKVVTDGTASQGLKFTGTMPSLTNYIATQRAVTVSGWVKSTAATPTLSLQVFYDNGAAVVAQDGPVVSTSWKRFSATFPAKTTTSGCGVPCTVWDVRLIIPSVAGTYYFDGVTITPGDTAGYGDWDNQPIPNQIGRFEIPFNATTMNIRWDVSNYHTVTLTANVTTITHANMITGWPVYVQFTQDGTGTRTVTGWACGGGCTVSFSSSVTPGLNTGANNRTLFMFLYDGTNVNGTIIPDTTILDTGAGVVNVSGADAQPSAVLVDSFATSTTNVSSIQLRHADGTRAMPVALANARTIGFLGWYGYGATGYSPVRTSIGGIATEAWSDTNQGAGLAFATTAIGGITTGNVMSIKNGLMLLTGAGAEPTGGDKGYGTINVATNIYLNNTAYTNPDFGLERWATGRIVKFANNSGATGYKGVWPLEKVESFARKNYYLPQLDYFHAHDRPAGMKERDDTNLLLHEETFIYLFQLNDKIKKLESAVELLLRENAALKASR